MSGVSTGLRRLVGFDGWQKVCCFVAFGCVWVGRGKRDLVVVVTIGTMYGGIW